MDIQTINLSNPGVTLTAYLPSVTPETAHMNKRKAMLVLPGGAYKFCSDREAEPIAFKFIAKGYAAFILRYSLNEDSAFPKPLNDAEEALELIRSRAREWLVDPDRVAVIGFSAGGHLAAMLSVSGRVRPNAQILGYPCILEKIGAILANPIPGADKFVDGKTPPAFIFAAADDGAVPIVNSLKYAEALDANGIPFEMHIFDKGGHGFSTAETTVYADEEQLHSVKHCAGWVELCLDWLDRLFGEY